MLQKRPAHTTQSAEDSSLDAWLEKYAFYGRPDRSVSYYDKGEILGVMLDLRIRQETGGKQSLQDLFHWMNQHYAKQGRFFPDSAGVREAAEAVTGADFKEFFEKYVAGTEEIDYGAFFKTVGLRLDKRVSTVAESGFSTVRNGSAFAVVDEVNADSEAAKAGLEEGDQIVEVNGKAGAGVADELANMQPGDKLKLKVRRQDAEGDRELKFATSAKDDYQFVIVDDPAATAMQRSRRAEWLEGPRQRVNSGTNEIASPARP